MKSLTVVNYLNERLTLPFSDKNDTGFIITKIDGLDPSKASINVTELATNDGGLFNSSRIRPRNVTLTGVLLEAPTIEEVRLKIYKYFPIKRKVTLIIETEQRLSELVGYVEDCNVEIFNKKCTASITLVCPDPNIYALKSEHTLFYGIEPAFEFPFSNESLTEPLLAFGYIRNDLTKSVVYDGDTETGVTINMYATGDVQNVTIYNVNTRGTMRINTTKLQALTGSGIIAGDEIIINTVIGKKSIDLLRGGVYTNILNTLDRDAEWFQLAKGDNIFAYVAESGGSNLTFNISNRLVYEGV